MKRDTDFLTKGVFVARSRSQAFVEPARMTLRMTDIFLILDGFGLWALALIDFGRQRKWSSNDYHCNQSQSLKPKAL
jgi:hypothetical protein